MIWHENEEKQNLNDEEKKNVNVKWKINNNKQKYNQTTMFLNVLESFLNDRRT